MTRPPSPHTKAATAAIERINAAHEAAEKARQERDRQVVAMHYDDGISKPQIARLLDMSVSNVRIIIDLHDAAQRGKR